MSYSLSRGFVILAGFRGVFGFSVCDEGGELCAALSVALGTGGMCRGALKVADDWLATGVI
jgi:hypothetical protein